MQWAENGQKNRFVDKIYIRKPLPGRFELDRKNGQKYMDKKDDKNLKIEVIISRKPVEGKILMNQMFVVQFKQKIINLVKIILL